MIDRVFLDLEKLFWIEKSLNVNLYVLILVFGVCSNIYKDLVGISYCIV